MSNHTSQSLLLVTLSAEYQEENLTILVLLEKELIYYIPDGIKEYFCSIMKIICYGIINGNSQINYMLVIP